MNLIEIRELYKNQEAYLDKEITVGGWVRSIRDSKAFGFIVINDGTFFTPLQVVYHDDMENFAGDFQTQCRSSCCCNRYTGCNTTGKTAI